MELTLLSNWHPGKRSAQPHARIRLAQPEARLTEAPRTGLKRQQGSLSATALA